MPAISFGFLGLIVGSFLNVLVLRHGARSVGGRSACLSCGREIAWYDLVPVFSWLWLRGRCRACRSRISAQYPAVELLTGLLFLAVGLAPLPLFLRVLGLPIAALLIAIAVYDLRHTIIPDSWAYSFAALALIYALAGLVEGSGSVLGAVVGGPAAASPLFFIWFISGGRWMGLGDSKLALGIGWLLGPLYGTMAVLFAFIMGASVSLGLIAFSSASWKAFLKEFTPMHVSRKLALRFTMKSEVPFGPFLIASCFIIWLLISYGIDPLRFSSVLSLS